MKFSIAAAAIAATSSFVGVHASSSTSSSSSTSKSGKGSCSSSPKLEKFCNEEPANFEGRYNLCYQNVIRNAASGPTGSIHQCFDETLGLDYDRVFTALDGYGAYEAVINANNFLPSLPGRETLNYQGIAQGNSIKMTTYGGGFQNENGDIVLPNESPDTQECTRYEEGKLKCMMYFQEYCGPSTANATIPIDCQVGEWLMTYTIEAVLVLEGFECPEPPKGFCESNQPAFGPGRKLQEEEEENEVSPCPFMNKKMN